MSHDPLADFDAEILRFLSSAGLPPGTVQLEFPKERSFGERSTSAALKLAGERRQSPRQIAEEVVSRFRPDEFRFLAQVESAGPGFLNFRLNYATFGSHLINAIRDTGSYFGRKPDTFSQTVVVEHTSVNPNKEWHIGHVRNAVLGDAIARLLRLAGDDVQVQNYIDDTGLQAAQSVLALLDFPEPQQPDEKFDHYAGRLYVKIASELAAEATLKERLIGLDGQTDTGRTNSVGTDERTSILARLDNIERLKKRLFQVMHQLEVGEHYPTVRRILDAQRETAARLDIYYDLLNWESHLVQSRVFHLAIDLLRHAPQVLTPDSGRYAGALIIETSPASSAADEPKYEVVIRSNGLPTYVGKDIAYHMWKFGLIPDRLGYVDYRQQANGSILHSTALRGSHASEPAPNRVINVIGVHQSAAQDTVKIALRLAGFPDAADNLVHLAYGMVSTPGGKISGRKGTSVSADGVIAEAVRVAHERVREKRSQELSEDELRQIAEAVGVGAVRYFMVQYNPLRDIVFEVADVVSYDGNTGLYIQYALVRMFAILRKAAEKDITLCEIEQADAELLVHEQERRLIFQLARYPETIETARRTMAINLIAEYAFELSTLFNQFYRDCTVLNADPPLRAARLLLVEAVQGVLGNACGILGVPVIQRL